MECNTVSESFDNILTHFDECIVLLDDNSYSELIFQLVLNQKLRKEVGFYGMDKRYCGSR